MGSDVRWTWRERIKQAGGDSPEVTSRGRGMSHEIAKLILEHANTFLKRTEAVACAISLGMPLHEVEDYLDWLDRAPCARG